MDALDVLPAFLQLLYEGVDGDHDVASSVIWVSRDHTDGPVKSEHLLELHLDSALDLVDFVSQIVFWVKREGLTVDLVKRRSHNFSNILDLAL